MPGTIVQFFATRQEILSFVEQLRADREMIAAAGHYSTPGEYTILRPEEPISRIGGCTFVHLKLGTDFSEENSLFICIGHEDARFLESSAGLKGEGPEFDYWKKQLAKFRRSLRKGAYVVNPYLDGKVYYKNVYYTDGAKAAYDRGVKMQACAGWNYYLLEPSEP